MKKKYIISICIFLFISIIYIKPSKAYVELGNTIVFGSSISKGVNATSSGDYSWVDHVGASSVTNLSSSGGVIGAKHFDFIGRYYETYLSRSGIYYGVTNENEMIRFLNDPTQVNSLKNYNTCIIEYLYNDLVNLRYRFIRQAQQDPYFEALQAQYYTNMVNGTYDTWSNKDEFDAYVKSIISEYLGTTESSTSSSFISRLNWSISKIKEINPDIQIILLSDISPYKTSKNIAGLPYDSTASTWGVIYANGLDRVPAYSTGLGNSVQIETNNYLVEQYAYLYTDAMAQIANSYDKCAFINLWNELILDGSYYVSQQQAMHLNQSGADRVASFVRERLDNISF